MLKNFTILKKNTFSYCLITNLKGRSSFEKPVEVNHIPAANSYKKTPFGKVSRGKMPAVAMTKEDHRKYITTGSSNEAKEARDQTRGKNDVSKL